MNYACSVISTKPQVVSLNETWLGENISDNELHLSGHNIIRRDRDSFGGGVAVYILDEHLQFNHINMEALSNIEALWSLKILFSSLYRPPNSDASSRKRSKQS